MAEIHGTCLPQFDEVRDAFEGNFVDRGELGSACAIYRNGEKLVDLWGGLRDRRRRLPWEEDTLVGVFSVSKGIAALIIAEALSDGRLELDVAIGGYWPEFAVHGKELTTVRQLLAHQAGVCRLSKRFGPKDMEDLTALASLIADVVPAWPAGERHGYHGVSLGWYENELFRRTQPIGMTIGQKLVEWVEMLEEEFYIGLPAFVSDERVAKVDGFSWLDFLRKREGFGPGFLFQLLWPWTLTSQSLSRLRVLSPADLAGPAYRRVEFPSANGVGTARALAKLYSLAAHGGESLGMSRDVFAEIIRSPEPPPGGARDLVLGVDAAYQLGFFKPSDRLRFGTSDKAFGAPGAGGSFAYADPDSGIGFAYVTNRMGIHLWDDPREVALRAACHRALNTRM